MTFTDIGTGLRPRAPDYGPLAELVAGLRASLLTEIRATILSDMAATITPQVTIAPPLVSIAAPQVTVTPNITLEGEDDAGEIAAMDAQTVVLGQILDRLTNIYQLLSRPVIKEVTRDQNREIVRITETR